MEIKAAMLYGVHIPKAYNLSEQTVEDIESLSDVYNLQVVTNYDNDRNLKSMSIGIMDKIDEVEDDYADMFSVPIGEIMEMKREFEELYTQKYMGELIELLTENNEYDALNLALHLTNGASVIAIAYEVD